MPSYDPAVDKPVDKPNLLRLSIDWPGPAQSRTAQDRIASAQVRDLQLRWSSYDDRVVQDTVVPSRTSVDKLTFQLIAVGMAWGRFGSGGYALIDVGGFERFIVHTPTVTDSGGRSIDAVLSWNHPDASIAVDPAYASVASFPITVSIVVQYAMIEILAHRARGPSSANAAASSD